MAKHIHSCSIFRSIKFDRTILVVVNVWSQDTFEYYLTNAARIIVLYEYLSYQQIHNIGLLQIFGSYSIDKRKAKHHLTTINDMLS